MYICMSRIIHEHNKLDTQKYYSYYVGYEIVLGEGSLGEVFYSYNYMCRSSFGWSELWEHCGPFSMQSVDTKDWGALDIGHCVPDSGNPQYAYSTRDTHQCVAGGCDNDSARILFSKSE